MMNTLTTANERLTRSRDGLRLALSPGTACPANPAGSGSDPFSLDWLVSLKTTPAACLLLSIFQDWWARQPLPATVTLAAEAVTAALQPVAQRYPVALVAGAALVGGLMVLVRPWRWISAPALLSGLLPQLLAEAMKHMPAPTGADTPHAP